VIIVVGVSELERGVTKIQGQKKGMSVKLKKKLSEFQAFSPG